MKLQNILLRVSGALIGLIIATLFLLPFVYVAEMNYKYLDYNNKWGVSYDCFYKEGQCYCHIKKEIVKVKQYYEVEK